MTETQTYDCPMCDYSAGSKESVVYHISGKRDETHKGEKGADHRAEISATSVDTGSGSGKSTDGGTTESVEFPTANTAPTGTDTGSNTGSGSGTKQCCNDPDLEGSAGDLIVGPSHPSHRIAQQHDGRVFIVSDQKSMMQLEDGDRLCMTCDTVQEAP
jgi:hypothetical protein